jgi:regulator of sigma E protease
MSYVYAFVGFAVLIILHEFGHFLAAKAVGMRVERFSLFFGPMLLKRRFGETEYGIASIPLGGYVKITGMNPEEAIPAEVAPRAYYRQPVWKRIVVIVAGPAVNLVIAFCLIAGIVWSNGLIVTRHGEPVYTNRIAPGLEAPASNVLRAGDKIVSVDGHRGLGVTQITGLIAGHRCAPPVTPGCEASTPVKLVIQRSGSELTLRIRPRYDAANRRMRLGISFPAAVRPVGPVESAGRSVSQMWFVTKTTVSTFARLFEPQVRSQIHGVVGGFKVTQERFAFDMTDALYTLAVISLSLAVINLFPFLPLDGGHVFWAVVEKLRGRRVPFAVMERAGVIGFALVLVVFVIGLTNDISTLTGKGFQVR